MIARVSYAPHEYAVLLDYCVRTTNLNPKAESILRSIAQKLYCNMHISTKQYEALNNIAVDCTDTNSSQTILRSVCNGEADPIPVFYYNYGMLDFPKETTSQGAKNVPDDLRMGISGTDFAVRSDADHPTDVQRDAAVPSVPEGSVSGQ
jgi:hypothetical protein